MDDGEDAIENINIFGPTHTQHCAANEMKQVNSVRWDGDSERQHRIYNEIYIVHRKME